MKEVGGYLELDKHSGSIYHDDAVALNCGRNCLAYLIQRQKIKTLHLPYFTCHAVTEPCRKYGVAIERYHVDADFKPLFDQELEPDAWLYIINYYGQISNDEIEAWHVKYERIIVDNAHAYFQLPVDDIETLYTCRKFFGVADGAFLYTKARLAGLERDESFDRMRFILGRYERTASEFYSESSDNNRLFSSEPVKQMSKLTENLLRTIDYKQVASQRTNNFLYLHKALQESNKLRLAIPYGAYMYPYYCDNGVVVRKALQAQKIYIPILWPDVLDICAPDTREYNFASNILPLPVDQRYGLDDMQHVLSVLNAML